MAKKRLSKTENRHRNHDASIKGLVTKYKLLSNASLDAIIIFEHGKVRYVNKAAIELFGYERMEIRNMPLHDLLAPGYEDLLNHALDAEDAERFEAVGFRKDGSAFPLEVTFTRFEEDADLEIRAAVFRNISKRKSVEKQLIRSERDYRKLFEDSKDAIYITGRDGTILDANQALLKLLGYSKKELLKLNSIQLYYDPEDRKQFQDAVEQESAVRDYEMKLKNKEGQPIHCLVTSSIRTDNQGNILGYQGIIRDITDLKRTEDLKRAKELAERSAALKSRFLANMSHEIRTPLNAVFGITNLLIDTSLTQQQRHYVDLIQSSTDHLLALINDILDFSKIEAGKMGLEYEEFSLSDLIDNLENTIQFRLQEKDIDFKLYCDSDVPQFVIGDSVRLNQVLLNLLSNAIKFTNAGGVELRVKLLESKEKYVTVGFGVKDTGMGIPKDKQQYIFELFTQGSEHVTKRYGGTGLGLAISKRLVEMMGGKLHLQSEVNKGSTFSFSLQFKTSSGKSYLREKREEHQFVVRDLGDMHILLVEDNKVNQYVTAETLKSWGTGMRIAIAENGEEAIAQVKEHTFDLIVMDVQMPIMDGHEATRYIRHQLEPPKRDIPILAMTAFATAGEAEKCMASGMNDYIPKPFNPKNFYNKVARLTHRTAGDEIKRRPQTDHTKEQSKKQVTGKALIDLTYLDNITQGDDAMKTKMLQTILEEAPEEVARIKKFYFEQDWKKLRGAAHKFKSSAVFVGNREMEKTLKSIELNALRQENLEQTGDMINHVAETFDNILAKLKSEAV